MRHQILVFVGLITAVYTKTNLESCFEAADPGGSGCCELDMSDKNIAIMKECREEVSNNNEICDFELCCVKKKGFLFSNGTVDYDAFKHDVETDFAKYSNIWSKLKQECFNGDINKYGQPEICHLKKITNCMLFYVLANCPKWSSELRCLKVKSASEECAKILP